MEPLARRVDRSRSDRRRSSSAERGDDLFEANLHIFFVARSIEATLIKFLPASV